MEAAPSVANRAINSEGCLFCRRHDGGFASEEHILGEGLGITDQVLPAGIVCDRCNNGPLARADRALLDFEPIQLLRAERGFPTRSKQAVISRWKGVDLAFTAPGELSVFGPGPSPIERTGPNSHRANLRTSSPFKAKRGRLLGHAIWKMAVEYLYLDHGVAAAFNPILDPVRERILKPEGTEGWLVVPKDAKPHGHVRLRYQPRIVGGRLALPVSLDVYGVTFYTDPLRPDLKREDIEPTPWPANVWIF